MDKINTLAKKVGTSLQEKNLILVTAESCTGGWLAQAITSIPGSSSWFDRGIISYSNSAKQEMLGVKAETLEQYGAVSQQVAEEMAKGALKHSQADMSISTTGIAGPTGGTPEKPVGLVWFAWATKNTIQSQSQLFHGDRTSIREQAVEFALQHLIDTIEAADE